MTCDKINEGKEQGVKEQGGVMDKGQQEHAHSSCHEAHDHDHDHDHDYVMHNLQAVRSVVEMLEASELCELAYACGDFSVRAVKNRSGGAPVVTVSDPIAHSQRNDTGGSVQAPQPQPHLLAQDYVKSPMVGTIYLSPKPGDPNFITQGGMVQEGQSMFIIEAMKTMNVIKAPKSGRVQTIFVENGAPVEFGQPLVHIQ